MFEEYLKMTSANDDKISHLWPKMVLMYLPFWFIAIIFSHYQRVALIKHLIISCGRDTCTAWKLIKYGVFSGPYFPAFGLNTERYLSLFSPNVGKYGQEKTPCLNTFHAVVVLQSFMRSGNYDCPLKYHQHETIFVFFHASNWVSNSTEERCDNVLWKLQSEMYWYIVSKRPFFNILNCWGINHIKTWNKPFLLQTFQEITQ